MSSDICSLLIIARHELFTMQIALQYMPRSIAGSIPTHDSKLACFELPDGALAVIQVGVQAYLLWEKAGKPDNADFSSDARQALERQLQSGTSLQDLERSLKAPNPAPVQSAPPAEAPPKVCAGFYA